jgi:hypothetical protein
MRLAQVLLHLPTSAWKLDETEICLGGSGSTAGLNLTNSGFRYAIGV